MSTYHVANADGLIKLDAMENPYNWPETIVSEWLNVIKNSELNRYPDPEALRLKKTIRDINRIPDQFEILLGNGSDEIILLLLMALPDSAKVLAPEPGFVMYRQISRSLGLEYLSIPLQACDFSLNLPAMLQTIETQQPSVIFLAYPNNPTGNLFDPAALKEIINAAQGLVVIDEAYAPFANSSFMDTLGQFNNLLVMRTLSKLGLAGLRLGYIAGAREIIEQLNKVRLPYNINILTQVTADFALKNAELFKQQTQQICSERAVVFKALKQLPGIIPFPSAANFILFRTPGNQATEIFESLRTQGILIKNLSPQGGLLRDCLRVTIGKPEENNAFLTGLANSLKF